jgi:hypothetical protein
LNKTKIQNTLLKRKSKSKHREIWSCNAFDEWRLYNYYYVDKAIANMSEVLDIQPFANLLFKLLFKFVSETVHFTRLHCKFTNFVMLLEYIKRLKFICSKL